MIASRIGFVAAAMLFAAGTAEAQRPRSDRDAVVLDGRIPVITDARGRAARVEDPRLYFARERDKCERHLARANWWRARGGRNAQKHALHETRKAEWCFDRLASKQRKHALRDARQAGRNRVDVARRGQSRDRSRGVIRTSSPTDRISVVRRGGGRGKRTPSRITTRTSDRVAVVRR